eukprot:10998217-Alexandrium_andersonii.AAC.1
MSLPTHLYGPSGEGPLRRRHEQEGNQRRRRTDHLGASAPRRHRLHRAALALAAQALAALAMARWL